MKTALYIEDGLVQLVLTPDGEHERQLLAAFEEQSQGVGKIGDGTPLEALLFRGQFYDCRGGWFRQKEYYPNASKTEDLSVIIRVKPARAEDLVSRIIFDPDWFNAPQFNFSHGAPTERLSGFHELKAAIQADPDFAWSWHCNVAVAILDEAKVAEAKAEGDPWKFLKGFNASEFCNRAAARFMKLCFDVDTSKGHPNDRATETTRTDG